MIKLSAFADEAGRELEQQIAALTRNGISYIEVRFLGAKNVADLTEEEAKEAKARLDAAGIRVWSIGSPLGKIKITDDLDAHMEKTRHVCRLAKIFGTKRIRMFSFYEAYEAEEEVYAALCEKGYDPARQIAGYILSEDPVYITNWKNARGLVTHINRDDLLTELIRHYFKKFERQ